MPKKKKQPAQFIYTFESAQEAFEYLDSAFCLPNQMKTTPEQKAAKAYLKRHIAKLQRKKNKTSAEKRRLALLRNKLQAFKARKEAAFRRAAENAENSQPREKTKTPFDESHGINRGSFKPAGIKVIVRALKKGITDPSFKDFFDAADTFKATKDKKDKDDVSKAQYLDAVCYLVDCARLKERLIPRLPADQRALIARSLLNGTSQRDSDNLLEKLRAQEKICTQESAYPSPEKPPTSASASASASPKYMIMNPLTPTELLRHHTKGTPSPPPTSYTATPSVPTTYASSTNDKAVYLNVVDATHSSQIVSPRLRVSLPMRESRESRHHQKPAAQYENHSAYENWSPITASQEQALNQSIIMTRATERLAKNLGAETFSVSAEVLIYDNAKLENGKQRMATKRACDGDKDSHQKHRAAESSTYDNANLTKGEQRMATRRAHDGDDEDSDLESTPTIKRKAPMAGTDKQQRYTDNTNGDGPDYEVIEPLSTTVTYMPMNGPSKDNHYIDLLRGTLPTDATSGSAASTADTSPLAKPPPPLREKRKKPPASRKLRSLFTRVHHSILGPPTAAKKQEKSSSAVLLEQLNPNNQRPLPTPPSIGNANQMVTNEHDQESESDGYETVAGEDTATDNEYGDPGSSASNSTRDNQEDNTIIYDNPFDNEPLISQGRPLTWKNNKLAKLSQRAENSDGEEDDDYTPYHGRGHNSEDYTPYLGRSHGANGLPRSSQLSPDIQTPASPSGKRKKSETSMNAKTRQQNPGTPNSNGVDTNGNASQFITQTNHPGGPRLFSTDSGRPSTNQPRQGSHQGPSNTVSTNTFQNLFQASLSPPPLHCHREAVCGK